MRILLTFVAQCVGISRFTSHITVSILFVTSRVNQTVTTTEVDTAVTVRTILTFYSNKKLMLSLNIKIHAVLFIIFQLLNFNAD